MNFEAAVALRHAFKLEIALHGDKPVVIDGLAPDMKFASVVIHEAFPHFVGDLEAETVAGDRPDILFAIGLNNFPLAHNPVFSFV